LCTDQQGMQEVMENLGKAQMDAVICQVGYALVVFWLLLLSKVAFVHRSAGHAGGDGEPGEGTDDLRRPVR
jgi:hypothetical protein